MSASKHTAGPWELQHKENCDWSIHGADGYVVASIPDDDEYGRPEEDPANAALITAAPDLLAALKRLVQWVDPHATPGCNRNECDVKFAEEAIAKAEGRS